MIVIWIAQARTDLRDIGRYIADFSPVAGLALVRRIRLAGEQLGRHPHIGRPGRVEDTRELVVAGTNYILPYRVRDGRVEILAALHTSREWPDPF